MGDNLQLAEIVVFGLVAAFLLFRLRSVLGRRTGNERPPRNLTNLRSFRAPPGQGPVTPVTAPPVIDATASPVTEEPPGAAAAAVSRIKAADRSFDETIFLKGARGAFEIIVNAFAAGDAASLRPLLSDEVYQSFAKAITDRQAARETQETNLVSIKSAEIVDAALDGSNASVTVKFVSDQINVVRAADGSVVEGEPGHVGQKTDIWTFTRNVRSADPNWKLTGTRSV
jgi:predicted lipid-binding transport protein (Tim44 family)